MSSYLDLLSEEERRLLEEEKRRTPEPKQPEPQSKPQQPRQAPRKGEMTLSDLVLGNEPADVQVNVNADPGVLGTLGDVAKGVLGGAADAVQGTLNAPVDIAEAVGIVSPETAKGARETLDIVPDVSPQQTTAGQITRTISKFAIGFIGAGKVLAPIKAFQVLRAGGLGARIGAGVVQGALGDFVVSDPQEAKLADLIESFPALENPVTEYLATAETDSAAEGRLKTAIEGMVLSPFADLLVVGVRAVWRARVARAAGNHEAAEQILKAASGEMEAAYEKAAGAAVDEVAELPPSVRAAVQGPVAEIAEQHLYRGQKPFSLIPGENMFVAKNAAGEDIGWMAYTKEEGGGFTVRKVEVDPAFRRQGVASKLYEHVQGIEGPYKGSTGRTAEGSAMVEGMVRKGVIKDAGQTVIGASDAATVDAADDIARGYAEAHGLTYQGKWDGADMFEFRDETTKGNITIGKDDLYKPETVIAKIKESRARFEAGETLAPPGPAPAFRASHAEKESLRAAIQKHIEHGIDLDLPLEHGVLNYTKMDSPDAVKATLDEAAKVFGDILPNVKGTYRSLEETNRLATLLGVHPESLRARLAQMAGATKDMDKYVVAGKTMIQSVARQVSDLGRAISFGKGGETAQKEFEHLVNILGELMDNVSGIQTAAARTTSAGRIRTWDKLSPAKIAELADRIAMTDQGNLKAVLAAVKPMSTLGKALATHNFIWINSILSGLKTTVVNLSSNLIQTGIMPAQRLVGGALMGDSQQMREAIYTYRALYHSIFDSLDFAGRAWKLQKGILDPGSVPTESTLRPISASFWNMEASPYASAVDWIGTVVGIPGRFLNTQDEFFKQINYRARIMAEAWVDAESKGLTGAALKQHVDEALQRSIGDAGEALNSRALLAAQESTFTQPLKREALFTLNGRNLSEVIASGPAAHPLLKGTVLPFIKVPTNLMRTFVDTGPLALAQKQFYAELRAGGERAAMAWGKLSTGIMLWTGAALLAASGRVTGAGPQDPDLQRQLRQNGWQPYSFVFFNDDGTKSYVSFGKLDPLAYFFGLAADFVEVSGKVEDKDADAMATAMVAALAKNLSSKTYLRGMIDVMGALGGGIGQEQKVEALVRYRLASYVPSILGAVNNDDALKEIRSVMDAVRARVPGLSFTVESRRDNFGQKMLAPMGFPYTNTNPFTFTTTAGDRVREELMRLAQSHAEAKFSLPEKKVAEGTIDLTDIRNKTGQTAWDRWQEIMGETKLGGRTLYEAMDDLIRSESYQRAKERMGEGDPTYRQSLAVERVKGVFDRYKQQAWHKLLKEYPELRDALNDYRLNAMRGRVLGPGAITPNPLIQR